MNEQHTSVHIADRQSQLSQDEGKAPARDRHTYIFVAILVLVTTLVVVAYYINHPKPELYLDTGEYLSQVQLIQAHGQIIDPHRVPGFPLLITAIFALTGQANVTAVSIVHAVLFVLSTLEIYVIALL